MPLRLFSTAVGGLLLTVLTGWAAEQKLTPEQTAFFESRVRPIFADNCYKCHSQNSEKIKGGLLLDSREGVLKGGTTGPAVVPGDLEKSLLIRAVHYTDKDLQMPPNDKKLSGAQIADLETWVKMGAPDPRTGVDAHNYKVDIDKARSHWAYQPVSRPPVPAPTKLAEWPRTPIDNFILAKLLEKQLTPSKPADKVTLLRRASFDLIGLPPSTRELDEFLADNSPEAFEKVVDRLLASPHYGERWGRFWLDLAHYADTKGQIGGGQDNRYLYAYTYRDWVIRALNEDLPYDQFIIQQIAADKLPLGDDKHALAAMGFLTLGNRFNNQINDIIDDRIDTVAKSTMAMTLTCARCHDHKFDPIPTKDYYALHGVFSSSAEPKEGPILEAPKNSTAFADFKRQIGAKEGELKNFHDEIRKEAEAEIKGRMAEYLMAVYDFQHKTNEIPLNVFFQRRSLLPQIGQAWQNRLREVARRPNPVFAPWFAFAELKPEEFATKGRDLAADFYSRTNGSKAINPLVARLFGSAPASLAQVAQRYAALFTDIDKRWQSIVNAYETRLKSSTAAPDEPTELPEAAQEQVREFLYARNSPTFIDENRLNLFIQRDNKMRNKLQTLQRSINDLKINHPGSPAHANVLEDLDRPRDSFVFLKGNPGSRGPVAPRQFLEILEGDSRQLFKDGSGRLELAKAIANPKNPLTARVLVNRLWLHHFGEGIARNPDDFGTRSDPPTHPELLDYLAGRFVDEGWSMKKMHKLIMMSAVYQQSSEDNPRYAQIDPENRWLWQMNRRRLDFEALRDTILFIGGKLDLSAGGPSVKLDSEPYSERRSVYGYIDRNNLPSMFAAFDFASPDLSTGKRESTVVPQQALFMMNSKLVVEQAQNLVRRQDFRGQAQPEDRIRLLYNLIYQRTPSDIELKLAQNYLQNGDGAQSPSKSSQSAWDYGYGEYDPFSRKLKQFFPMLFFRGNAWIPNSRPGPAEAGLQLRADGGSPGRQFAAIRRWTAPRDGTISIDGILVHNAKEGDGVAGRIVSMRTGEMWSSVAFHSQAPAKVARVAVKKGDQLCFLVESRKDPKADGFNWSPSIKYLDAVQRPPGELAEWNAQKDFSGTMGPKGLDAWEKFAQVLLETNELTFVN